MTRKVDAALLKEASEILERLWCEKISIHRADYLSNEYRINALIRVTLHSPRKDIPQSLIIKQSLDDKSVADSKETFARFARDWAGLEFLADICDKTSLVPKFYGGSVKHRFILIEDLGEHHLSLVDALTGADRKKAEEALERYVKAMATLHGLTHSHTDRYRTILQKLEPKAPAWYEDHDLLLRELTSILQKINLKLDNDTKSEIREIFSIARKPGHLTALIHGDICPDNVFDDPHENHLRIIDFEWSFIRNALLDAVFLRMSMPTCWCTKALPEDVIETYENLYRNELCKYIEAAKIDTIYEESYMAACAYWMLWTIISIEDRLYKERDTTDAQFSNLHPNWQAKDCIGRPRVIHRLECFKRLAKKYRTLPHLRLLAEQVLNELESFWPYTEKLELYAAFKEKAND